MSKLRLTKIAEPSTPAANKIELYMDTLDNTISSKDYNGLAKKLGGNEERQKNILINGGFSIQQRVAVGSTAIAGISTTTRAGVVSDRWAVTTDVASNLNWQQVDGIGATESLLNSRFYGSIISATAGKKVMLSQFIIASEMAHVRGRKVRFTCKVKQKVGSAGQTYKMGIIQLGSAGTVDAPPAFLSGAWSAVSGTDPAWSANTTAITPESWGGINGSVSGSFFNITTTAGWVESSAVWTIPSDAKGLYVVIFANADGGTTDNISFAEVRLHQGIVLEEFVEEPFIIQLIKCQAYYSKSFPYGTVPVQSGGLANSIRGACGQTGAVSGEHGIFIHYPVQMRTTSPTVTLYNPSAGNAFLRNVTGATDATATSSTSASDKGTCITATGTAAWVKGDGIAIHYQATAEIVV